MIPIEFKEQLLKATLKGVDKSPEEWVTFNNKLHSRIIYDNVLSNNSVVLLNSELPIFECTLEQSYALVTTDRLISVIDGCYRFSKISNIKKIYNDYEKENFSI